MFLEIIQKYIGFFAGFCTTVAFLPQAVKVWKNMQKLNKGKEPPQFLSTHPSSANRIISINNWVNEIIIKYPPIRSS